MDRAERLRFLCSEVLERRVPGRPLKVAIDGRCGSGKSRLASDLAAELRGLGLEVLLVSMDGFHHPREHRYRQGEDSARGYYEDAFDCGAVVENLLRPLSAGSFPGASADLVLVFEGVFALRKELDAHWDFRVLLDVDAETAIGRAVVRDAGAGDPVEILRKYLVRYEPAWLLYVAAEHPELRADLVV